MRYLFVLAHPDDEIDVGGTIWRLSQEGHLVAVAIVVGNVAARRNLSSTLHKEEEQSMRLLGVLKTYHADFPNIRLNTIPHSDIFQFVEECILDWKAQAIVTHHTSDVNIDHVETGRATISAFRQFFPLKDIRLFLLCETSSATEWALNPAINRFRPNYYVEIGTTGLDMKLKALQFYKGVLKSFPHPQSCEVYKGLASFRGAQSGCNYAEAFQCVFMSE